MYEVDIWDSISVKTYDFDAGKLDRLPMKVQQFICSEMQAIGLPLTPRDQCRAVRRFFAPKVEANTVEVTVDANQYPNQITR